MPDEHHVLLKEDVRNLPDTRYLLSLMPLLGCLVLMTIMLAGCDGKKQPTSLPLRPVRFVTVGPRESPGVQTLTGEIRAHDEKSLSFRRDGRILTRSADL
ncbi:efflux RND transporter periplasmic adaptor subunit, partial [Klebsiella pneumoniae]